MLNKDVILAAMQIGFFRAKSPEKREMLLGELMESQEFEGETLENVAAILLAETNRREMVKFIKQKKALEKAEAEANKPLSGGVDHAHAHVTNMPPGKYVVTVAQNNTDVDPVLFNALQNYCAANQAKLLIAKMTYNKNGWNNGEGVDPIYYDPLIVPFAIEGQISLGGNIDFCAQANVLPTAKNPLSGFEAVTPNGVDVIIPASKIALKCTAALKGMRGKILYSTGSITKRNYITRKAGAVASTEHNLGALFVDSTVSPAIVRQLEKMDGSNGFYDDGYFYSSDTQAISTANPVALQFGDIHAEKMTSENLAKIVSEIRKYDPDNIILHDVLDFSSRNHHNVKDCAFMFNQAIKQNTVENDLIKVTDVIDTIALQGNHVHIIESNHDLAINTWLKNEDFKTDPINALTYLKCMTALYSHIDKHGNTDFNMLQFAYKNIGYGKFSPIFHNTDESVIIAGVEMGCHGHSGINGSRGSPAQFRSLGIKINTGHTHTPSIMGGCYTAGVAGALDMGYNIGASSWQLANILTWPNGQRQIVFM